MHRKMRTAKVIACENNEDIYVCFSGLKVKKPDVIPTHVKEDEGKETLKDLQTRYTKEKLKRTPPQKNLPVINNGKIVQNLTLEMDMGSTPNITHTNRPLEVEKPNRNPPTRPLLPPQLEPAHHLETRVQKSRSNTFVKPRVPLRSPVTSRKSCPSPGRVDFRSSYISLPFDINTTFRSDMTSPVADGFQELEKEVKNHNDDERCDNNENTSIYDHQKGDRYEEDNQPSKSQNKNLSNVTEDEVKAMERHTKQKLKRVPPQKNLPVIDNEENDENLTSQSDIDNIITVVEQNSMSPTRPLFPPQVEPTHSFETNLLANTSRKPQVPPRSPMRARKTLSFSSRTNSKYVPRYPMIDENKMDSPAVPNHVTEYCNNEECNINDENTQTYGHQNEDKYEESNPPSKPQKKKIQEVVIFYRFTQKVRLDEALSLSDLRNIAEAQIVPEGIHMSTIDERGKYKSLTEETFEQLLESGSSRIRIVCSRSPDEAN